MEILVVLLIVLFFSAAPFFLLWVISAWRERRHMDFIVLRERALAGLYVTNLETPPPGARDPRLVTASVVLAPDAWKMMLAGFRQLFGGRMRSLETVIERARREALLRMLEEAARQGADGVVNVRLDTASIVSGTNNNNMAMFEVIASGTAVRLQGTVT